MADFKYKLSIIVPMYNAEKYIGTCLDSILESNLPKDNYEIVIVNDGSKDKGPDIVHSYITQHSNISYYTQENQGQSAARNQGIKVAKGEYIWCVDSDDKLDKNLNIVLEELKRHNHIDILAVQLKKVSEQNEPKGIECSQPTVQHNILMKGRDAVISGYNPSSVCALITRRDFVLQHQLFFKVGITHQDVELSYQWMTFANEVLFTYIIPYIYILHPNSTSQSINPQKKIKYVKDDIVIIQSFKALAEKVKNDEELSETIINRSKNILFGLVYSLHTHKKVWSPLGVNKAVIAELKKEGLYPIKESFPNWKQNIIKYLLNIESFIQ